MPTADQIRELLNLKPLPVEGGYFAETYKSACRIPQSLLPPGSSPGDRELASAIYYLLTPDTFSALHKLAADEMYHLYLGDPVELFQFNPDRSAEVILLGHDIAAGMRPQHVVPAGTWQGSRLRAGGAYALLGTTMSPGFDYRDYHPANRQELTQLYPAYSSWIASLTR